MPESKGLCTWDCPYEPSCHVGAILYGCPFLLPITHYQLSMINFRHTLSRFNSLTTLADRLIIGLAIALLVWLYMRYWITERPDADYALILAANQAPKQVDLQHTQQISIQGSLGESLIEVSKGRIRFIASPCRHKQCIHAGWLTAASDFVACLPNQVSIELHRTQTAKFDAIAY